MSATKTIEELAADVVTTSKAVAVRQGDVRIAEEAAREARMSHTTAVNALAAARKAFDAALSLIS
jgi:hypothetical protein